MERIDADRMDTAMKKILTIADHIKKITDDGGVEALDPQLWYLGMLIMSRSDEFARECNAYADYINNVYKKFETVCDVRGYKMPDWKEADNPAFGVDGWVTFFNPKKGDEK